jgi:hypothetical protein
VEHVGPAHTAGDAILVVPDAEVTFTSAGTAGDSDAEG